MALSRQSYLTNKLVSKTIDVDSQLNFAREVRFDSSESVNEISQHRPLKLPHINEMRKKPSILKLSKVNREVEKR